MTTVTQAQIVDRASSARIASSAMAVVSTAGGDDVGSAVVVAIRTR